LNLDVPLAIDGVDSKYLNPRNAWDNTEAYDEQAAKLAGLFVENIVSFAPSQEIIDAGPQLEAVAVD
jgi:phosphoenolpyruvate carboxykinase (ATP)